jgi:hypothetical protein
MMELEEHWKRTSLQRLAQRMFQRREDRTARIAGRSPKALPQKHNGSK